MLTHFNSKGDIGGFYKGKDIGKEPCSDNRKEFETWKALSQRSVCRAVDHDNNNDNMDRQMPTHILSGCPRHTTVSNAQQIMRVARENKEHSHPTFLMLIRDPIDRLVSHLNDDVRRGGRQFVVDKQAGAFAKTWSRATAKSKNNNLRGSSMSLNLYSRLSLQGHALKNLLDVVKDPSMILIVPMESMKINPQGVVDAVMDHVGGDRWSYDEKEDTVLNRGNSTEGYKYQYLSDGTRDALRDIFREDVQLLESLVGKNFSWSSWAYSTPGAASGNANGIANRANDWLVTTPNVQGTLQ